MGKAQSKRSVDITTEVKDGNAVDEGTGKMGKIEDVDQLKPQLNGDTNHKDAETTGNEKAAEKDEAENEKDTKTEKIEQTEAKATPATPVTENGAGGDATTAATTDEKDQTAKAAETENVNDTTTTTLNESKEEVETGEEVNAASTPVTDSTKKPKKEKSKKRFLSFRSFSFSKKDKQKPAKKGSEENAANVSAATNGECEKVPEEATEEATPATEQATAAAADEQKASATPLTNGTSEEKAVDEAKPSESAPPTTTESKAVAPATTQEEPVKPAAKVEIKPIEEIKQVAEETVEEAIVAASKSVDEKINLVSKPEVNAEKDFQEKLESSEQSEQSSEKANVDTNNIDTSVGLGDCTNNIPPPPLPETSPPSQISVFAETAMSVTESTLLSAPEQPQPIPIIETNVSPGAALVGTTKIELTQEVDPIVAPNETAESSVANVDVIVTSAQESAPTDESASAPIIESNPKPEEIAETIAILDSVNESEVKKTEELSATGGEEESKSLVVELNTEPIKDDLSADISSPLQQNSLESLPSPQSLSSVNGSDLPPPPSSAEVDAIESATNGTSDEPKTNGDSENHKTEENDSLPTAVQLENGTTKDSGAVQQQSLSALSDDIVNTVADAVVSNKENGIGKETIATEKQNGDAEHKSIEEIATSPEKLEKLAAANPPPSTEVATTE